ncbi:MAG TPA: DNA ligase [Povalibacter sp.]
MRARTIWLTLSWPLLTPAAVSASGPAPPLQLANVYRDDVDVGDYWVSEKYDGIRAFWNGSALVTRNGNHIHAPAWFVADWPAVPLDGELWIAHGQFEAVTAVVRDVAPDDEAWRRVRFMVFDLPSHAGAFNERLTALRSLVSTLSVTWVHAVAQWHVSDEPALMQKLAEIRVAGGEGLMLHRGDAPYHTQRSDDLLKLKMSEDAEARVIGYLPGKGKYQHVIGALQVERPDGLRFNLGTGFTDEQRRHPPTIGSWVTYAFHGTTAKGVPRFASFLRVREDGIRNSE